MKLTIHIDGGSRGNPGPAGAGVVLAADAPIFEGGFFIGEATNNVAEYTALLRSLELAVRAGATDLTIYSDSELMVRQINGDYSVKNAALRELFDVAYERLRGFERWKIHHVRREGNVRADELANLAMDAYDDVIVMDRTEGRRGPKVDDARRSAKAKAPTHPAPVVVVTCTAAPSAAVCPAPCCEGDEFRFASTIPEHVCVDAAGVLVEAVGAVRDGRAQRPVQCGRRGCGAEFRIEAEKAGATRGHRQSRQ